MGSKGMGIIWLAAVSAFLLTACAEGKRTQNPAPAQKTPVVKADPHEGHGHEEAGEADCITIDIGDHEFLGDMDFDAEKGSVVLTVNDHATGKPHPHAKAEATLNVVLESGTAQIKLAADPLPEDPEGKTSRYKVTDAKLKGVKMLKGRVNLTIDGKAFLCDLKSSH